MWRRALLLVFFFSVPLLLTPALPAKNKPKTAASDKMQQDFSKFVEIPGAEKTGAEQCAMCHAATSKNFRRSAHSMQDISCEQCHGAGSLHVAAGGYSSQSKDKIISFRDRSAEQANGVCLSCHAKSEHVRNWFSGAHQAQDIKCADHTAGWEANAMRFFLAQFERFRKGEPLLNVVDKKLGY